MYAVIHLSLSIYIYTYPSLSLGHITIRAPAGLQLRVVVLHGHGADAKGLHFSYHVVSYFTLYNLVQYTIIVLLSCRFITLVLRIFVFLRFVFIARCFSWLLSLYIQPLLYLTHCLFIRLVILQRFVCFLF